MAKLLAEVSPEEFLPLSQDAYRGSPTIDGRYLHWDELRRRPPPTGLTPEQWWLRVAMTRQKWSVRLPLRDTNGRAFRICNHPGIQKQLHLIDSKCSGRIEALPRGVNRESSRRYVLSSLVEEAISSSLLEGAATTRSDAKKFLAQARGPRTTGERMVVNNYQTMQQLSTLKDEPLSLDLLLRLHASITAGTLGDPEKEGRITRPGELREVVDSEENVVHCPPPPEELPRRLEQLIEFANASDMSADPEQFLHPVLRGVLLHFWLAYDHPFLDGNGRAARALFYWSMLRRGYWFLEYVSISELLLRSPGAYYRAFQYSEAAEGDCTYFIQHQLDVIVRAIEAAERHISERQGQLTELGGAVRELGLNPRQQEALRWLLAHPGGELTFAQHQHQHQVTYQTARTDLIGLEQAGLLRSTKAGRSHVFSAARDLEERLRSVDPS